MSSAPRHRGGRSLLVAAVAGWLALAGSCGFPDHSFISDDEFYGTAGRGGGGPDASVGGDGGGTNAGGGGTATGGGGSGIGGTGGGSTPDASVGGTPNGGTSGGGTSGGGNGGQGGVPPGGAGGTGGSLGGSDSGLVRDPDAGGGGTGVVDAGPFCEGGLALCGGGCVDLMSDDSHCGDCGVTCAFDEQCTSGICQRICSPGLDLCGVACVDFQADDTHCGDCVTTCNTPTEICINGTCQPPCTSGLTLCSGNCVDTDTDSAHCGGCAAPCAGGEVCEIGTCRLDCGPLTRCVVASNDVCADLTMDDNHCGACNSACTGTDFCADSSCHPDCGSLTDCGGTCVNTNTNDGYCGNCVTSCLLGQDCIGGICTDLVEDCTNGTDDDEDTLTDCMDPDCTSGYTCASVPAGWTGPVVVWSGTFGATPSCPNTYPTAILSAYDDLTTGATVCPDCTCTPSGGSTCGSFTVSMYDSTNCAGVPWSYSTSPNSCHGLNLFDPQPTVESARIANGSASYANGSCILDPPPTPTYPIPSWGTEVAACGQPAVAGGGCAVGSCLPRPQAPFGSSLCVFRGGLSACPPAYPNAQPTYYQTYLDGRSCSSCSCKPLDCGGRFYIYTDTACTIDEAEIALDGSCTQVPGDPTQGLQGQTVLDTRAVLHTNPGPVCGNVQRTATGSVTPDTAITVCCQ